MSTNGYVGVSLRVYHATLTPAEIAMALERYPSSSGIKGEPRGFIRGTVSRANWTENYWCSEFTEGETLEARVGAVIAFLSAKEREVAALVQSGGRARLYLFLAPDSAIGVELDPAGLALFGRLGVTLELDVVGSPQGNVPVA